MQELEKILEEIDIKISGSMGRKREGLLEALDIISKHTNDGWILVEERLPEDLYTPSELYEKWFLITTPFGEEKVVQRTRCVPTGYIWFDGYDSVRVSAWRYIEPYRPERSNNHDREGSNIKN